MFLIDGKKRIHEFSDKHPGYNFDATEAKFDEAYKYKKDKDLGYPQCRTIAEHGSGHCKACPHLKLGKSPLNIGLEAVIKDRVDEPPRLPAELRNMLYLVGDGPVGDYKTRKHLLWAFIHTARRKGIDENKIVDACLDETYRGCAIHEHVRDNGGKDYIKEQIERAINSDPLIDEQQRTIIRIEDGKLDELWRAVQRELIKRGCPVYVRGNRLVQPLWRWEKKERTTAMRS